MEAIVDGKTIQLSEAGWLENLDEWNEALAPEIAKNEEYFHDNGTVCEPRAFSKLMKKQYGKDRSDQKYLYSLFPTGLIKCANKIAGLPRPKGCS
jgi:tRNA 2-thiouridine synthesizing protein E